MVRRKLRRRRRHHRRARRPRANGPRAASRSWRGWLAAAVLSVALVGAAAIVVDRVVRDRDTFIRSVDGDRAILWAVGDGANGSADGKAVAALIARDSVDAVLYLGDVYNEGTAEDFEENYDTTYGRLSSVAAPTSGNHEADNEDEGYDPYWRRAHGERPPDWYAFEAAGWAILSLDSELDDDDDESEQRRWVEAQVRAPGT